MELMMKLEEDLDSATDALKSLPHGSDTQQRKNLAAACDRLRATIESPVDLTTRLLFSVLMRVPHFVNKHSHDRQS